MICVTHIMTMRRMAAVLVLVLSAATVTAQNQAAPQKSVLDKYKAAKKHIDAREWAQAIDLLNQAVAADGRDRIYRDSTVEEPYFPHHYLFVAYTQSGDFEKARASYEATPKLPKELTAESTKFYTQLLAFEKTFASYDDGIKAMQEKRWQDAAAAFTKAIAADAKPKNGPPKGGYFPQYYLALANLRLGKVNEAKASFEGRGTIPKDIYLAAEEPKFADTVEFIALDAAAQTAFDAQRFQEAVDNWNKACGKSAEECGSRNIRQKIADAQQAVSRANAAAEIRTHVANATALVGSGDYDAAKKEYKTALDADAGNAAAAAGMKAIQDREERYNQSRTRADQLAKANDSAGALKEYESAKIAHGQWFTRDKVEASVRTITDSMMKTQGVPAIVASAQKAFQEGRWDTAKQQALAVLAREATNDAMKSLVERSDSRILYDEGRKLAAAGDFMQADQRYANALKKDAKNSEAERALNASAQYAGYVTQRNFDMARKIDKVRFDTEHPEREETQAIMALVAKAKEAYDNENFGDARRIIKEVLAKQSTNGSAIGLRNLIDLRLPTTTPKPVVATAAPPPAAAPTVPMTMWLVIGAVVVLGAGSIAAVRSRAATPVAIDSLPWARVTIMPLGRFTKVDAAERTTPFAIELPRGEYMLRMTSDWMSEPYTTKIKVAGGQPNTVLVTMPAYDVEEVLTRVLE